MVARAVGGGVREVYRVAARPARGGRQAAADGVLAAGQRSLDPAWRLPADGEYGDSLKSNFADFANAGSREGGASVAANFHSRFVGTTPWAHLDIAGVAWKASAEKGATGRVVPLLADFLLNL